MAYSSDLIRFVSNVPVLSDGTIPLNTIKGSTDFVSTLYQPVYTLSILARMTQSALTDGTIEVENTPLDTSTIVYKALHSDLATFAPNIYLLLKAVVLESFVLLYNIDNSPQNLQYVSTNDIKRCKTNINYIADFFSTNSNYYSMIESMRDMNISFGYLENQIEVIMNEAGV